ncbi:hypothetical protein [Telluribacter sp. SYSU D00476]|uniref:hypothetical protein n=1 Tax=Telluribacter sp. SYSU D00476 TaxID=2811430 RepID=UPI001FF19759|nr:hypothetical protein [Telluribacter sp. SYSU D00476]
MNTITTQEQRQFEELLQDILSTYNCTFTVEIDQKSDWLACLIKNEVGTVTDMHLTAPALREILTTYEGRNEFEKAIEERFRPDC